MRYNLKQGYKKPIDSALRMAGLFLGTCVFSLFLIPIYYSIGGNANDAFFSALAALIFSSIGMGVRLYFHHKKRYYY
jgi:hypothetical protein